MSRKGTENRDGSSTQAEKRRLGFESLEREIEVDSLEISGEIPEWVEGSLFRNGPAKFEVDGRELNHWFDGYAMLHLFTIKDGKVGYKNKYLESDAYKEVEENDKMAYSEFATDPCRDIFERAFSFFQPLNSGDNANVSVGKIADEYVAMTETPMPVRFNPETLETKDKIEYDDDMEGDITTAHPHYDSEREATISYVTKFSRNSTYKVYSQQDGSKKREVIGDIEVDKPSYMHSFGMTDNYIILVEYPLVISPLNLVIGNNPFIENFEWKPERGTRFTFFDKDTGEVVARPKTDEAFFGFHHINAYEKDQNEIAIDISVYPSAEIVFDFYLDELKSESFSATSSEFRRFNVDLSNNRVESHTIFDGSFELPRINYERCNARDYRYAYGVGRKGNEGFLNQIVKVDIKDEEVLTWHEEDTFPGEPVFVEAPEAENEDEGVVLSVVLDAKQERSFLLVLDASNFDELARAETPHVIPNGFHGQFYES